MESLAAAVGVAWSASWRLIITVTGLVGGTSGCVAWVLLAAGLHLCDVSPLLILGPALGFSIFLHEAGHAVAHEILSSDRHEAKASAGTGTFRGAEIVRWSAGREADTAIALVGPACGLVPLIALLAYPGPHLLGYPLIPLFLFHLLSLAPTAADGAQLVAYCSEVNSSEVLAS